jgi:hypothetical protein
MNRFIIKASFILLAMPDGSAGCSNEPKKAGTTAVVDAGETTSESIRAAPMQPPPTAPSIDSAIPASCPQFNDGGGCTPTEQRFLDKSPACFGCLVNAGCLNDAKFSDRGHECSDVDGVAMRGAKKGTRRSDLCLATLDCILSKGCAKVDVALCYCGALGAGNGCTTAKSGAKGACLEPELDGLEHPGKDPPSAVVVDYFNRLLGAGMANQVFTCARDNGCQAACTR